MNKTMKFGYSDIGKYTVVKLNVKLDPSQIDVLKEIYKDWLSFEDNGFAGVRIEGVLPNDSMKLFVNRDLKRAKLVTEALKINAQLASLNWLFEATPVECWTKANLNEI